MADALLQLGNQKVLKKVFKLSGVPIPIGLIRPENGWNDHLLMNRTYLIHSKENNLKTLTEMISSAKGTLHNSQNKCHGLIFDATSLKSLEELDELYLFFKTNLHLIKKNGRIVLIGQNPAIASGPELKSVFFGLHGFIKSLAKEVGRIGVTVNLVTIPNYHLSLDYHLPVIHFLLSDMSSFISGQIINLQNEPSIVEKNSFDKILKGKTAVITGAARGIGRSTAITMAQEGAKVICIDLESEKEELKKLSQEINGDFLPLDITSTKAPEQLATFIIEKYKKIDIIIHNAGITRDKTLKNMSKDQWSKTIAVNTIAPLKLTEELFSQQLINSFGKILFLSSINGIAGAFGQTNYALSKSALIGLTEGLSKEQKNFSFNANAIAPGFIETRLTKSIPFMAREAGRRLSCLFQGGIPEDVANLACFLSSSHAQAINGELIRVCGGHFVGK